MRSRRGAANAVLQLVADKQLELLCSPPLFLEYEEVLKRPEQMIVHELKIEEIDGLLAELAALILPVDIHFRWRPQSHDPNDEMVLEAAINGNAEALVTFNVSHFASVAERFNIRGLRPAELIWRLRR